MYIGISGEFITCFIAENGCSADYEYTRYILQCNIHKRYVLLLVANGNKQMRREHKTFARGRAAKSRLEARI